MKLGTFGFKGCETMKFRLKREKIMNFWEKGALKYKILNKGVWDYKKYSSWTKHSELTGSAPNNFP